jgi:hypothetical protein
MRPAAPGSLDLKPSAVGSIELRVLRKIPVDTAKNVRLEEVARGRTFEDSFTWWDVSRRLDTGVIAPTYEIA